MASITLKTAKARTLQKLQHLFTCLYNGADTYDLAEMLMDRTTCGFCQKYNNDPLTAPNCAGCPLFVNGVRCYQTESYEMFRFLSYDDCATRVEETEETLIPNLMALTLWVLDVDDRS